MVNDATTAVDTVMSQMLEPVGLDERKLSTALGNVVSGSIDYADLYFQVSRQESWSLEDGVIREGSFSHDQGVGVRIDTIRYPGTLATPHATAYSRKSRR